MNDDLFIARCLEIAARGGRDVAPNPMVGAVIARDGTILAEGWHAKYGSAHAEIEAIRSLPANSDLQNATLYVNLEPCCHQGKTPPCTRAIIDRGIRRVVFCCCDPNPKVRGGGAKALRDAGIEVHHGIRLHQAVQLNRRFYTTHALGRPYVILKWAQTADGYLARSDYSSKWISGEESRRLVHQWRAEEQAVMVGFRTALYDNPALTVRHVAGRNPLRVVIDHAQSLPRTHHLFDQEAETVAISMKTADGLPHALELLKARGINSVLVEGGAALLSTAFTLHLWDEARVFTSTKTFGSGVRAPSIDEKVVHSLQVGEDTLAYYFSAQQRQLPHTIEGLPL